MGQASPVGALSVVPHLLHPSKEWPLLQLLVLLASLPHIFLWVKVRLGGSCPGWAEGTGTHNLLANPGGARSVVRQNKGRRLLP